GARISLSVILSMRAVTSGGSSGSLGPGEPGPIMAAIPGGRREGCFRRSDAAALVLAPLSATTGGAGPFVAPLAAVVLVEEAAELVVWDKGGARPAPPAEELVAAGAGLEIFSAKLEVAVVPGGTPAPLTEEFVADGMVSVACSAKLVTVDTAGGTTAPLREELVPAGVVFVACSAKLVTVETADGRPALL